MLMHAGASPTSVANRKELIIVGPVLLSKLCEINEYLKKMIDVRCVIIYSAVVMWLSNNYFHDVLGNQS